jgi:L-ornithine Nalpha-acyltransferase
MVAAILTNRPLVKSLSPSACTPGSGHQERAMLEIERPRGGGWMNPLFPHQPTLRALTRDETVRDTLGLPVVLGRHGDLELCLATTRKEIRQAQKLRYQVFFEEMGATPTAWQHLSRRDKDAFDRVCDHLLVYDRAGGVRPKVVGTYRLLRQEVADANFGFYTSCEFEIAPLIARHPTARFLELGRSCVLKPYRTRKTVELLWQGIWAYVLHHRIDVMFGCASLSGTDPRSVRDELSFLHRHAPATGEWHAAARAEHAVAMETESGHADDRRTLAGLPPLIKGYLRLGCRIGDGAVVDRQFGTTDVLIVLPVKNIDRRYIAYYGQDARPAAA